MLPHGASSAIHITCRTALKSKFKCRAQIKSITAESVKSIIITTQLQVTTHTSNNYFLQKCAITLGQVHKEMNCLLETCSVVV